MTALSSMALLACGGAEEPDPTTPPEPAHVRPLPERAQEPPRAADHSAEAGCVMLRAMAAAGPIARIVPSLVESDRNVIREAWDRLSSLPGGNAIFSRFVGMAAPYTASMGARVVELGRGHSKVVLPDRRAVRNHLRCIHAVALANLAELTGNVAVAYTLPDDARFIVAGLEIEYLKKARGTITGTCECPLIDSPERREYDISVVMRDPDGVEVARATLRTLVGPKKRADGLRT